MPSSAWSGLLDHPHDRDVLAPLIEQEIRWRVIDGPLGESVRQAGIADSSPTHIAVRFAGSPTTSPKPFRVDDLAGNLG